MSGSLANSQAEIIRQLLVNLSLGSLVASDTSWPVYITLLPDKPDNSLCVYNTEGQKVGRLQPNGESQLFYGIQIKVRGVTESVAYVKAMAIVTAFDNVLRSTVIVGGSTYLVQSVNLSQPIISLGSEVNSKRRLYTINFLSTITQTS